MNHLCRSSLHRTYGILSLLVFCQIQSVAIFPLCHICRLISFKIYQLQVWESKTDSGPALAESSLCAHSCTGTEALLLLENVHSRSGISSRRFLWTNIDLNFTWICGGLQKPRSEQRNRDPLYRKQELLQGRGTNFHYLKHAKLCTCRESQEEGRVFLT